MTSENDRTAVIVDPHPLWLDAVEQILNRTGIQLVGKTTSMSDALELVEELEPDLFITELVSEGDEPDGLGCLAKAREYVPDLRAIVLSMHCEAKYIDAALQAGAAAYVVKTAHPDDLASAIRQSFDHSIYLANNAGSRESRSAPDDESEPAGLTRRELEILTLAAEGHSNAELAKVLWVTEQTIKFHLSNIYRKLGVANRTEASRWAQLHGLLPATDAATAAA